MLFLFVCFIVISYWWSFLSCASRSWRQSVWVWVASPPREFRTLNGSWLMDHWVSVLSFHTLYAQSLQSCLILCDPMVHNPPDSSVHGILQARILDWVVMPPSPGDLPDLGIKPTSASLALQADSLPLSHLGNPILCHYLPINIPSLILYYKNFILQPCF